MRRHVDVDGAHCFHHTVPICPGAAVESFWSSPLALHLNPGDTIPLRLCPISRAKLTLLSSAPASPACAPQLLWLAPVVCWSWPSASSPNQPRSTHRAASPPH